MFLCKYQVISVIERRADQLDYVLVDTPGQIEIFTWSASGAIITEAFASTFPTVIAYVVDTPRCESPVTFMSNMLYACSILYKTRLPLVLAFNKTDVAQHQFALEVSSLVLFSCNILDFELETASLIVNLLFNCLICLNDVVHILPGNVGLFSFFNCYPLEPSTLLGDLSGKVLSRWMT